jgi:hypothetical protein
MVEAAVTAFVTVGFSFDDERNSQDELRRAVASDK